MCLGELSKIFFLEGEQMNSLRQWLAWGTGDREIFAYQVDNSFFYEEYEQLYNYQMPGTNGQIFMLIYTVTS